MGALGEDCTGIASDDDRGDGGNFRISRQLDAGTYHPSVAASGSNSQADYTLELEFELLSLDGRYSITVLLQRPGQLASLPVTVP